MYSPQALALGSWVYVPGLTAEACLRTRELALAACSLLISRLDYAGASLLVN